MATTTKKSDSVLQMLQAARIKAGERVNDESYKKYVAYFKTARASAHRVYNMSEDIEPVSYDEYVDAYIEACAEEENAKAKKQDAANHIKEFLGDYDKATCLGHSISWKPVTSERLDSKSLKENEPEIYAKYCKSSTSRRFTLR